MNEFKLILACLKNPVDEKEIGSQINNTINWDRFADLVKYHSLASPVLNSLHHFPIPLDVKKQLREYVIATMVNNSYLFDQLRYIVEIFEKDHIQYVLLKGFALDSNVYAQKGLVRQFVDIDVLVEDKSVGLVQSLLTDDGYELKSSKKWNKYADKYRYHYAFNRIAENRVSRLEIHTNLYPVYSPVRVYTEDLFSDSDIANILGLAVPTLSIENVFIHACTHFSYIHADRPRLSYLFEIGELMEKEMCWDKVVELAIKQHATAFVYYCLILAIRLLGKTVPYDYLIELKKEYSKVEYYLISKLMGKRMFPDKMKYNGDNRRWLNYYLLANSLKKKWLVLCDYISTRCA